MLNDVVEGGEEVRRMVWTSRGEKRLPAETSVGKVGVGVGVEVAHDGVDRREPIVYVIVEEDRVEGEGKGTGVEAAQLQDRGGKTAG